jgi:hypothetical protein
LIRKTISPAPKSPMTTPKKMVFPAPSKAIFNASCIPSAKLASKTSTASIAPSGSIRIPSHLRMAANLRVRGTCLSNGTITVGPVTTRIAPNNNATWQSNPSNRYPARAPASHVTITPTQINPLTAAPACFRSAILRLRPPSKRISATAIEVSGNRRLPNSLSGTIR